MDYAKESLRLHGEWKGKIEVVTRVPAENKDDLSLAYTPGVAQPCLEIQKDVNKSYDLTRRWNMCLVVTDGSAILGLGNIGPEAGMPVMAWNRNRRISRTDQCSETGRKEILRSKSSHQRSRISRYLHLQTSSGTWNR